MVISVKRKCILSFEFQNTQFKNRITQCSWECACG